MGYLHDLLISKTTMNGISQHELVKLVRLYNAHCTGVLTPDIILDVLLNIRVEIDRLTCLSQNTDGLEIYYKELEYLLFDIMHYDKEQ
mgnify:FL=1